MKLKDMKIRTQLRLGLGMILALVALLGAMAWFQADSLWQATKGLYDHPFAVRRALSDVNTGILVIHQMMEDLFLAESDPQREEIVKSIDTYEAIAARQFAVLRDRYLGSVSDVDAAQNAFVQWKAVRDETIRLLRAGQ